MPPSIKTLFDIFIFRAKPQDIDPRGAQFKLLLLVALPLTAVFIRLFLLTQASLLQGFLIATIGIACDIILVYGLLSIYAMQSRFIQTFIALLAVQCVTITLILILRLALPSLATQSPSPDAVIAVLFVQLWSFGVFCMIIKEALESSWATSIFLNIALAFISHYILTFSIQLLA